MAIKANLIVDQGTSYSTSLSLVDDEGDIPDLSGYSANAQIRKTYSSSNAVSFSTTINSGTGQLVLTLSANQTSNIVAGRYVYDVLLTDASGIKSRIVEGIVTVTPRVTQ
jgi:hypothetical protein